MQHRLLNINIQLEIAIYDNIGIVDLIERQIFNSV